MSEEHLVNVAIEMHDSTCLAVKFDKEGRGSVVLDAYVHRTEGEPGVAPGECGLQQIRFLVDAMIVDGEVEDLPAWSYEGSLTIGRSIQNNMVPFPAKYSYAVQLSLMLGGDARTVVISGTGLSIESEGPFRFVESFIP
jgi:hypothetical protein